MLEFIRDVRQVLDRRTETKLLLGALGLVALALLDVMAVALVFPLVSLASGSVPEGGLMPIVQALSPDGDIATLLLTTAVLVVSLFISKSAASVAFIWWLGGLTSRSRASVSTHLLGIYLTSPYEVISRRATADLLKVQQDAVNQMMLAGIYALMTGLANTATIIGMCAVLMYAAPVPTVVLIGYFAGAAALYLRIVKPATTRAGLETIAAAGLTWRAAMTALGAVKEIQLRYAQRPFVDRYADAVHRAAQAHRVAGFLAGLPRHVLEVLFIVAVGLAIVLTSGAGGDTSLGLLGVFVAAGFRMLPAVTGLLSNVSTIRVSAESARQVTRDWQRLVMPDPGHAVERMPIEREIVIDRVGYQYRDGTEPVLTDVSLRLRRGSTVAVVGPSGSGKTTLVDLVMGFYPPTSGSITADGLDVVADLAGWRANIGYVPQDVFLVDGTIEENIAFDADLASYDQHASRLTRVLQQADLTDLVDSLPHGVRTQVGERGSRLSGGQKQRIGIARALYRDPRLLVLDEATSALDNATEHRVAHVLNKLGDDVTVIVVAHRLSTVKEADMIVLLEGGRVSAVGTFGELRHNNAVFSTMVRLGELT